MDQVLVSDFKEKCKVIYNFYRVQMLKHTPYLQGKATVTRKDFITFFKYLEKSVNDMDKLADPLIVGNPEMQDSLNAIIYSYVTKYNAISKMLRKRFKK